MVKCHGSLLNISGRPQPAEANQAGETTQACSKGTEGSQEPECKKGKQQEKGKQLAALSDSMTASSDFEHIPGPDGRYCRAIVSPLSNRRY